MDNSINWNTNDILKVIESLEEEKKGAEEDLEGSSWPEGENTLINSLEDRIRLLEDMVRKDSWYYKHFNGDKD